MKYEILVIQEIDSSHQLKLPYTSGCNNMHGHRWRVEVGIECLYTDLNPQHMVVDFQHIKHLIKMWDHIHMNDKMGDLPATAEEIGCSLYNVIEDYLQTGSFGNPKASVTYLKLFETPSGSVTIRP